MAVSRSGLRLQRLRNLAQSVALLLAMAAWTGALGWLIAGGWGLLAGLGTAVVAVLAASRVSPWMVLRMYGAQRLQPWQAPGLFRIVQVLSERAEVPAPELFYIRSPIPNAISIGSRRQPGLAVTDGLIRRLDAREMSAVLAHELSHIAHGDLVVMAMADSLARYTGFLGQIGMILLVFGMCLFQPQLILPALVLAAGPTLSALLMMALSRAREFDADLGAVRLTGDAHGLATALQRIEQPSNLLEQLFGLPGRDMSPSLLRTHPATRDRIERLEALEEQAPRHPTPDERVIDLPVVERDPRRTWWGAWH